MSVYSWLLARLKNHDNEMRQAVVNTVANEHGVSPAKVKADIYLNALTRGSGFADYLQSEFYGASKEQKDTYLTARSYYRLLEYLNNLSYISVMQNKILFCNVFRNYLGREFINLRTASVDEFCRFIEGKRAVFAKQEDGFGGHGVSRVSVEGAGADQAKKIYDQLRANKQFLVEQEIVQAQELNDINPNSVCSFRVVTLVKDGKAHLMGNALRINQTADAVIGCTGDLYYSLGEDGKMRGRAVDDLAHVYEEHPLTGKRFDEVVIPGVREAFDLCLKAALEVPQVRYVGWDIAFSEQGPVLMEGNAYPAYCLVQFNQMTGKKVGHLAEIAEVLGSEMDSIKL